VAIEGRNFKPRWGLYNGAIGTVEQICYSEGESPNEGHLPKYIVVNFPQYKGPVWDKKNPKVTIGGHCSVVFVPVGIWQQRLNPIIFRQVPHMPILVFTFMSECSYPLHFPSLLQGMLH
jgi:hypothetical protein